MCVLSLEHCRVSLTYLLLIDNCYRNIDLNHNTQLISLTLGEPFLRHEAIGSWRVRGAYYPYFVGHTTSLQLRHVIIHAKIDYALDDLDALDWASIAASLRRPHYSKLLRFTVCISVEHIESQPSEEETMNWIMERFPALVHVVQIQFHITSPVEIYPAVDDGRNGHWSTGNSTRWDEEL